MKTLQVKDACFYMHKKKEIENKIDENCVYDTVLRIKRRQNRTEQWKTDFLIYKTW